MPTSQMIALGLLSGPFLPYLLVVALSNIVAGAGLVVRVYYFNYLRGEDTGS